MQAAIPLLLLLLWVSCATPYAMLPANQLTVGVPYATMQQAVTIGKAYTNTPGLENTTIYIANKKYYLVFATGIDRAEAAKLQSQLYLNHQIKAQIIDRW